MVIVWRDEMVNNSRREWNEGVKAPCDKYKYQLSFGCAVNGSTAEGDSGERCCQRHHVDFIILIIAGCLVLLAVVALGLQLGIDRPRRRRRFHERGESIAGELKHQQNVVKGRFANLTKAIDEQEAKEKQGGLDPKRKRSLDPPMASSASQRAGSSKSAPPSKGGSPAAAAVPTPKTPTSTTPMKKTAASTPPSPKVVPKKAPTPTAVAAPKTISSVPSSTQTPKAIKLSLAPKSPSSVPPPPPPTPTTPPKKMMAAPPIPTPAPMPMLRANTFISPPSSVKKTPAAPVSVAKPVAVSKKSTKPPASSKSQQDEQMSGEVPSNASGRSDV